MSIKFTPLALFFVCIAANAEEPVSSETVARQAKTPILMFELPNRGALAALIDKGTIKLGISGSIKSARFTVEQAAQWKGSVLLSCADSHSVLAMDKSLASFADDSLSDVAFILLEKEKCKERFISAIARTGASS